MCPLTMKSNSSVSAHAGLCIDWLALVVLYARYILPIYSGERSRAGGRQFVLAGCYVLVQLC